MFRALPRRRGSGAGRDSEAEAFFRESYPFPTLAVAVGTLILADVAVAMTALLSLGAG